MKEVKMKPNMVESSNTESGFIELVKTTEEVYNIQKEHWLSKVKYILKVRDKNTDKSEIDKCILEDDYYLKNFNPNRFEEYGDDLINIQSESDMRKYRGEFESYMKNWRLYSTNENGYINPVVINYWFKNCREELIDLL